MSPHRIVGGQSAGYIVVSVGKEAVESGGADIALRSGGQKWTQYQTPGASGANGKVEGEEDRAKLGHQSAGREGLRKGLLQAKQGPL